MAAPQSQPQAAPSYLKGVVKQVLSGDSVIVRGLPKGGPPPERQINFSNVIAPKLARRATNTQPETADEPFAWEAREFLRKKLVGKDILFTVETKTQTGREYGTVFLGRDTNDMKNVTEMMVSEGLLSVRRESFRGAESNLATLEDNAKAQGKGKWSQSSGTEHVRDVKWTIENLRSFVDKMGGKPIKAVIEHVRDGSTVRAFLLPDFYHITLMISGIRCPMFKVDSGRPDKANAEPFAEEARYFVESRLLQRDVEIILETYNNNNLVGSIKHPNGNIADLLLREGFARCVDWSITTVSGGPEKLRAAEKHAKNKKLRLWTDYKPAANQLSAKDRDFVGKVIEVVNGDSLVIKRNNGKVKKVFLSSIRPPRLQDSENQGQPRQAGKSFRPLYDIPWLYEAREFLRKKLIGQKVHATVDYVQPAQNNFPEKVCCTVKIGDLNVAQAMVSKGLATVVRYRQDDDQRASCYDDLLSAEAKAIKEGVGLHSKKDIPIHRVADISGDPTKAKNFLPFLQRAGKTDAVVEFVASGSRMRLFIPKETCLITFLLAGITCPKATRPAPGGVGGTIPGEPFGAEALEFTKEHILQREVQIEVDTMDKGGNFIGWLNIGNQNLSVMLVEHGLSSVHITAEASKLSQKLSNAEQNAKKKKIGIWANYEEEKTEKIEETVSERKLDYKSMMISEVTREGRLYGQYCSDGPALERMMETLRQEFTSRQPVEGSYTPKKGELCAAKFVDGSWYRAKVEKNVGGQVSIFYVDYGNREVTTSKKLSGLPSQFLSQPPYAHELALALVKFHGDEETVADAVEALVSEVTDKEVRVNKEYKYNNIDHYTIQRVDTKTDVAKTLLSQGWLLVDPKKDKKLQALLSEYKAAQDEAKNKHLNIWQYGDVTDDDAFEFGMER